MAAPATANDFATLGLHPSATPEEVERAFQRLALQHHPDRNADPRAAERFGAITAAYERIRGSGIGRIYRVGEAQPEDADLPRHSDEIIPFDQAHYEPIDPVVATFASRFRLVILAAQAAIAIACLALAAGYWYQAVGTDHARMEAFSASPICSTKETPDCIRAPLSAAVDATLTASVTPIVGEFPDALRLHVIDRELDVGVSRPESGTTYGGLQANDTTNVVMWHGEVVGVNSPSGPLRTDFTPSVIADRHSLDAKIWLVLALVLAIRPIIWLIRRLRSPPAEE